jgi:gluconate 5-dehydrogenase
VVICSEDAADLRATELMLGPRRQLGVVRCDVTDVDDVEHLLKFATRRYDRIDAFINNARANPVIGKTADVPIARGRRAMSTDVLGTYYGSVCALRHFERQRGGRLINVLGRGAHSGAPYASLQVASKAWIRAFTATAREEYAALGIEVGSYDPGILFPTTRSLMAVTGEDRRVASMRWLTHVLGAPVEVPGAELARLALSDRPLPAQSDHARSSVVLSRAFVRLVLRKVPPFAATDVVTRLIPAERSLRSN